MNVTCIGAHCVVDESIKIVSHQQNITNITFTFNNEGEWNSILVGYLDTKEKKDFCEPYFINRTFFIGEKY